MTEQSNTNDGADTGAGAENADAQTNIPESGNHSGTQQHGQQQNWQHAPGNLYAGPPKFFDWFRSLGLVREPGWIGGVSAGLARKIGIDVSLIRGILVVLAILGFPVLFVYGVAWLLLPDTTGKIHLEELFRGNLELPLLGIGVALLFGLSAFGRGIWPAFSGFNFTFFGGFWATLWSLVVIAGIITAIYFIGRSISWQNPRPQHSANFVGSVNGENSAAYFETSDSVSSNFTGQATSTNSTEYSAQYAAPYPMPQQYGAPPLGTLRPEPVAPRPPINGTPDEMAAWRNQQDAWRAEHSAWKAEQNRDREAWRQARRAEQQERRRVQMEEQRIRMQEYRARNPRLSGAIVLMILGLALIIGALVSLSVGENKIITGIATTSLVLALGMVFAAVFGRKTSSLGFLSFLGILAVLFGSIFPNGGHMLGTQSVELTATSAQTQPYTSPVGRVDINLSDLQSITGTNRTITLKQGVGQVRVYLPDDASIKVELRQGIGNFTQDGDQDSSWLEKSTSRVGIGGDYIFWVGPEVKNPDFVIVIEQGIGTVRFFPLKTGEPAASSSESQLEHREQTSLVELQGVEND